MIKKTSIITPFIVSAFLLLSCICFAQRICSDTVIRNIFYLNRDSSLSTYKNFVQSNDYSYLISRSWKNGNPAFNAVISKRDQHGSFLWSKSFTTDNDSSLVLSEVLELADETIVGVGNIQSPLPYHNSEKPILLHIDKSGNLLDCWRIDLKETSKIDGFFRMFLCQLTANTIALLVNYSTEDATSAFIVMKLNITNGSCVWENQFYKNNFFYVNGMAAYGNELFITCNFSYRNGSLQKNGFNLIKLSSITGLLGMSKSYENIFGNILPTFDNFGMLHLLGNGDLKLVYSVSKDNEPNKIVSVNLNKTGTITSTKCVANIADIYLVRNYSINGNGSFAFSFFNSSNPNDQGYIVADSNCKLVQQRKLTPTSGTNFSVVFPNNDLYLSNDNRLTVFTGVTRNSKIEMEFISTNIYNKDTGCIGNNFNEAIVEDFSLQSSSWTLDQQSNPLPVLSSYSFSSNNLFIQQEPVCLSVKNYDPALPDKLTKCNNDSVLLKANSDFESYSWQPTASQIPINDSTLKVFPSTTTNYSVIAQTYWGCEMKDTVKIQVVQSPVIDLGNDTSICEGSAINLDAGSGFVNYLWNDGATTSFKKVTTTGIYFVKAVDANGCFSEDTFNLPKIYPRPAINIHQRQILCEGQSDVLKPGMFDSYLWQDGSSASDFKVKISGKYWVTVTDDKGCINSDTVFVTRIAAPPSGFIVHDTAVCQYGTIQLNPIKSFLAYLWSTNSSSSSISVNAPGTYWISVTDSNGCNGREYINVSVASCPTQIFFPSAFTPNGDGKNELFKPTVKGTLDQYELSIFNRWGQKIFSTNDSLKGWNGTIGNKTQNGVFIWLCKYQFKDQKLKIEKGSFVLIR